MIKIIKTGTRKQIECKECGCLFSYEEEDIRTKNNRANSFDPLSVTTYDKYIECPQCSAKINM